MKKETFRIVKMDCPSEEQLIRMKLEPYAEVKKLEFDIPNRMLVIYHDGQTDNIVQAISGLNLGSSLEKSEITNETISKSDDEISDKKLLWIVFAINVGFFVIEIITGFIADSMGLVADSLDMLADAIVYGMSLMVVGSTIAKKKRIAKLSGFFQLALAVFGLFEVVRRFLGLEGAPDFLTMVLVSVFALVGNAASLYLLQKKKSKEAHMEASYIFTSNDVIANIGVIVAGIVVYFTQSAYPDLIIGTIVFLLVARGAFRILKLSK
ncbi:MAG TPA: cation diffusion facilitator family transporter [Flavipsychrobacter sp.]